MNCQVEKAKIERIVNRQIETERKPVNLVKQQTAKTCNRQCAGDAQDFAGLNAAETSSHKEILQPAIITSQLPAESVEILTANQQSQKKQGAGQLVETSKNTGQGRKQNDAGCDIEQAHAASLSHNRFDTNNYCLKTGRLRELEHFFVNFALYVVGQARFIFRDNLYAVMVQFFGFGKH